MNLYECANCSKIFKNKRGLKNHINNKVCEKIKKYICDYCNKEYTKAAILWNHKKKFCKKLINIESDTTTILMNEIKGMKNEMEIMKIKLENTTPNIINNNTNINNVNNVNNVINFNVLAEFGKEDLNKLSSADLLNVLSQGSMAINMLVEKMHFNINLPENHNIYFSNLKDKYGSTYNGIDWITRHKDDIIDTLFDDKLFLIEEIYKTYDLQKKLKNSIRKALEKIFEEELDPVFIKETKEKMKMLIYNKREYPQLAKSKFLAIKSGK